MLSGAIGLQIIARRLGVELGEQQLVNLPTLIPRTHVHEIKKRLAITRLYAEHQKLARGLAAAEKTGPFAQLKVGVM